MSTLVASKATADRQRDESRQEIVLSLTGLHDLCFLPLDWILLDRTARAGKPLSNGGNSAPCEQNHLAYQTDGSRLILDPVANNYPCARFSHTNRNPVFRLESSGSPYTGKVHSLWQPQANSWTRSVMPSPRTAFHQRRVLRWPKGVTYLQTVSTANLERSDSIDTQLPTNSILHACRELLQLRAILVSIHYEAGGHHAKRPRSWLQRDQAP